MGELFDFITDNPVAGIFIAWFLYRLLFGGKDKAKKAQEQQQAQMKAAGTRKKSFQERLEEALKEAQAATQVNAQSGQPTLLETARAIVQQPVQQPVATTVTTSPAPQTVSDANDPFAFHSLTSPTRERAGYDQNKESFSYHEALNEPVEQAFHLKGFTGFHEAHGLSHGAPIMKPQPLEEKSQQTGGLPDFLGADGGMHRAIVLSEILGRPRALRRLGS